MPIYVFECRDCGHQFEVFASFSQKEKGLEPSCPKCTSQNVGQVFSGVGFFAKSGRVPFNSGGGGCCPGGCS
jgi:putative FmdB family regulatory protein